MFCLSTLFIFCCSQKSKIAANAVGGMIDEADTEVSDENAPKKRSLSEPRDRSALLPPAKRSRSLSPGLRSPIKQQKTTDDAGIPPTNSSKRRLVLTSSEKRPVAEAELSQISEPVEVDSKIVVNGTRSEEMIVEQENGEKTEVVRDVASDLELDAEAMKKLRMRALKAIKNPGRSKSR